MVLINSIDPFIDFYESNPESKIFFAEEYESNVPSSHMWAVAMYIHPSSKLFNEPPSVRRKLIIQDYLKDPKFDFSTLDPIIDKFKQFCLTKTERLLVNWEKKLYERDDLIDSIPYTADTYDILDKMIDKTPKMWQQYYAILDLLDKESKGKIEGDVEESLSEKGDI